MSGERHARLKSIFDELSGLEPGASRDARLLELCGPDAALRAEAEKLLHFARDDDDEFLGAVLNADLNELWADDGSALEGSAGLDASRYEILRQLGEGGFGTVYLAHEREPIPRLVAIKVVKPGMDTREVLARFDTERRALAAMDHPGIAHVFAAGADRRGRPYFVMEYVEGRPITEFCDEGQLSIAARLELFIEVCEAIQHAHYKGIVHRDVKPGNVLVAVVDGRPCPKVIDFGIAKAMDEGADESAALTCEGQLVGTPLTMSPEQARGGTQVDTRADVYGLGGLAYELLCGAPPFALEGDTKDLADLRQEILNVDPPRPSARLPRARSHELSADLDWIVMKALAKEPERRYSSARDLALDVERYLRDEPVSARPPSRSYQAIKFARRHRAGLVAASIMLLLLIAGSIGTAVGWRRSVRALHVARQQEELAHQQEELARQNLERARLAETDARRQALRAQSEADLALAINAFLNDDLLLAVSPESLGFDVPMRRVLDVAASKVSDRFADRPRIERAIRTTLGRTYRTLSLPEQAEEQLTAAIAIDTPASDGGPAASLDPTADFRERARALHELAHLRLQQSRNAEAEVILRELWTECSARLGDTDLVTIDALHSLGVSLAELERFEEARTIFETARARALDTVGPEHELAIQALHSQGLLELGRTRSLGQRPDEETASLIREALDASRALHGPDDPRTVRKMVDLAAVLSMHGQGAQALSLYEDAYERSRRVQGPQHPTNAIALLGIGHHHLGEGSPALAAPALEQALEITTALGEAHPLFLRANFRLAICRLQDGRLDEAEALALTAFDVIEQGKAGPDGLGSLASDLALFLAEVCTRADRNDDAALWRQAADDLATEH